MVADVSQNQYRLNAICPYFTMFPLDFPKSVLTRYSKPAHKVIDPFCGRGTTNFAARQLGLSTVGIDSSPVASAITWAKIVPADPVSVVRVAREILRADANVAVPSGVFWRLAYHPKVLRELVLLRAALLKNCASNARKVLRGIILGALHGPLSKTVPSYFSNQCTRTYAPKPDYAVKYWRKNGQKPPVVDVLALIERRAKWYLQNGLPSNHGKSCLADSRDPDAVVEAANGEIFDWVITSPPYFGMRTYLQDQWIRHWFVGGSDQVNYSTDMQLDHVSPECFEAELSQVWHNLEAVCNDGARMVIRFGGISDRRVNPLALIKASIRGGAWKIKTVRDGGSADCGKRQAQSFLKGNPLAMAEYDIWARLE